MDDDSSEGPVGMKRDDQQAGLLRQGFERWRHAAYIKEALRRAGRDQEADERKRPGGY
jgi:hypothetical protein